MLDQASFDFTAPPAPADDEVERLVLYLISNPGFHTARRIESALDLSDRRIRQLAEAARGTIISGPGSPGYCHIDHCPLEKLSHIAAAQLSQGRAMIRRSLQTSRLAHARIHHAFPPNTNNQQPTTPIPCPP